MSIIFGLEGVWFNNDISASVDHVRGTYGTFLSSNATVKGPSGSETVGFIGPSIEFGWHF
jgi:hypothetical protein